MWLCVLEACRVCGVLEPCRICEDVEGLKGVGIKGL